MSTPPPPSSSKQSYSSTRGKRTQQTRNRGANAANHNRWGHSFRLNNDGTTTKRSRTKNTKRAPRWEREGDQLYAEVTKQLNDYNAPGNSDDDDDVENAGNHLLALTKKKVTSAQDVCQFLEPWTATDEQLQEARERKERKKHIPVSKENDSDETPKEEEEKKPNKSPPFLWGPLPIGPVLATRLQASERPEPTPVQRAAFPILTAGHSKNNKKVATKRTNAIIASPTGTGKTLAYLLPLLCTSPGGQSGEGSGGILIVTPTIELAVQIQREVDVLWPPIENKKGEMSQSSCFVVGDNDLQDGEINDDDDDDEKDDFLHPGRAILRSIHHAPLIAGTPKMLRMLYKEAGRIVHEAKFDRTITKEERTTSREILTNLRSIVLDEADRLLRTEAVARETTERKQRKITERKIADAESLALDNYIPPPPKMKKKRLVIARETQTEFLLRDLPIPSLDDVQIICASATIGRTMRRQLMQILDAPSADAAATLVTGDEDERVKSKDAERRKSVLLPEKLQHAYRVVNEENESSLTSSENSEELSKDESVMSAADRNEEKRVKDTIDALWDTMTSSMMEEAKPIIVFPGRVGVERVQQELIARGLNDVRTLRNLDGKSPETDSEVTDTAAKLDNVPIDTDHRWESVPVYIIGERFARGLDLPDVEYVFMLSPPSSAAGYAHMAGRTGRVGRVGTAITLVRPKNNEVQRLAAIADALGLKFVESMSGVAAGGGGMIDNGHHNSKVVVERDDDDMSTHDGGKENRHNNNAQDSATGVVSEEEDSSVYPWLLLTEAALKRKKNDELYDYLGRFDGGEESNSINKRSKKADLVSAIQSLHSKK